MKLWGYPRSSASYRLRIALEWKGLDWQDMPVDLRRGEQHAPEYLGRNPQGLVPLLEDGPHLIGQSLAVLEYLEETRPDPPLLPAAPAERARVRQLSLLIACDVHPLQNLRVLEYLHDPLGCEDAAVLAWNQHWIHRGFAAFERILAGSAETGRCCHGDLPSFADVCLVPQLYNARRREVDLAPYPTIRAIEAHCLGLDAFTRAAPRDSSDAG